MGKKSYQEGGGHSAISHLCHHLDNEPDFMLVDKTGGAEGAGHVVLQ